MPSVIKIDWTSAGCTNSDISIALLRDSTPFFSDFVKANKHSFFYDVTESDLWSATDTSKYSCIIYTNYAWTHGDTTLSANLYVKTISIIQGDETGQKHLVTTHSVELSKIDSQLETINTVDITREDSSILIFFTSDITTYLPVGSFSDVPNMYTFDMYNYGLLGRTTPDGTGVLKIYKDDTCSSLGVDGTLVVSVLTNGMVGQNYLNVFIGTDYTSDFSTYYIGEISEDTILTNGAIHKFDIPSGLFFSLAQAKYQNASVFIEHCRGAEWEESDATFRIYDVYIEISPALDTSVVTDNTVVIYDSTELLSAPLIQTNNSARIHTGTVYTVIDYYTPGSFWDFTVSSIFSYREWNNLENIVQQFGRMTYSLLLYEDPVPEFVTMSVLADSTTGTFRVTEEYQNSAATVSGDTTKVYISFLDRESYLSTYSPEITPSIVPSNGQIYLFRPHIVDGTVCISIYVNDSSRYILWQDSSLQHPLLSDTTFYLSMLGKR